MGTRNTASAKDPAYRRVLILGKGPETNGATRRYLEYCGHKVRREGDPDDAVVKAATMRPHVVICELDRRFGEERVAAAAQIQETHEAKVVLVTNYHRGEIRHRFPHLEVGEFLRKPISLMQLESTVAAA